jgi:hypothetical protein
MSAELALSAVNDRRLGRIGKPMEEGRAGRLFRVARRCTVAGLALRLARRLGPAPGHASSALFLAGGLAFRLAWLEAGRASAKDDEAIVTMARRG